jgi:hypothetical protein
MRMLVVCEISQPGQPASSLMGSVTLEFFMNRAVQSNYSLLCIDDSTVNFTGDKGRQLVHSYYDDNVGRGTVGGGEIQMTVVILIISNYVNLGICSTCRQNLQPASIAGAGGDRQRDGALPGPGALGAVRRP